MEEAEEKKRKEEQDKALTKQREEEAERTLEKARDDQLVANAEELWRTMGVWRLTTSKVVVCFPIGAILSLELTA